MENFRMALKRSFGYSLLFAALLNVGAVKAEGADDTMQRNLLNLQNQVQQLQDKLALSQGQIEELNHEKSLLLKENTALKEELATLKNSVTAAVDEASKNEEKGSAPVEMKRESGGGTALLTKKAEDPKTADKSKLVKPSDEAQKLYQEAYALLNQGKFDEASKGFKSFILKNPNTSLTPNAWYWLGQVQYKQKNFKDARVSFLNAAKFKTSDKRADALYKLGITSRALGDNDKAKKFYEVLIKSYPDSSSAALASKELKSM